MYNKTLFAKHFLQIKKGGVLVILKKSRSFIFLLLQIPIYLISIPILILLYLMRPWFLIRWQELYSSRIGHFSANTELYCCERDEGINFPSQRYLDLFYLMTNYSYNKQLGKMWRRTIIILPRWLLFPIYRVNRFFGLFISSYKEHEIRKDWGTMRDVHNIKDKYKPHISFTSEEEFKGKEMLKKFGLPDYAKFICLVVRDSGFLNRHQKYNFRDWSYHDYRNGDIDNYVLAAEELTKRGYYVFRMGINVLKPIKSSNPKVIDYANSGMRSDFMDVYLAAKCTFCITTATGIDGITYVFQKPIVAIHVPFGAWPTYSKLYLSLTKHHINIKNQKELTVSEIFSSNVAVCYSTEVYKKNNVELKENSPEEIRDLAIEMDERLNGNWNETNEDIILQKKFWSIYEENIKNLDLIGTLHGKIRAKFGAKFLRENKNWIK